MGENVTGPLLSDRRFFQECLNLEYEGMQEVKASVLKEDFCGARKAMAAYIRRTLDPERFLQFLMRHRRIFTNSRKKAMRMPAGESAAIH